MAECSPPAVDLCRIYLITVTSISSFICMKYLQCFSYNLKKVMKNYDLYEACLMFDVRQNCVQFHLYTEMYYKLHDVKRLARE